MYFRRAVNELPFLALKSSPTALQGMESNRQGSLKIMVIIIHQGRRRLITRVFPWLRQFA